MTLTPRAERNRVSWSYRNRISRVFFVGSRFLKIFYTIFLGNATFFEFDIFSSSTTVRITEAEKLTKLECKLCKAQGTNKGNE